MYDGYGVAPRHHACNPGHSTRVQRSDHLFIRKNVGKSNDVPHNRVGENSIGELAWVPRWVKMIHYDRR